MAGKRQRASQCPGAGRDSLRRRAHRRGRICPCNQPPGHRANDTTDLSALERPRLPRSCRNAGETRREPRGGLGCRAHNSTCGSASTDSSTLLPRDRESARSGDSSCANRKRMKRIPARAGGHVPPSVRGHLRRAADGTTYFHARIRLIEFSRRAEKLFTGLLTAGLIRHCAATAASRRFLRPARRQHADALAYKPTPCRTMGGFSLLWPNRSSSPALTSGCPGLDLTILPIRTLDDVGYGPFESTLGCVTSSEVFSPIDDAGPGARGGRGERGGGSSGDRPGCMGPPVTLRSTISLTSSALRT